MALSFEVAVFGQIRPPTSIYSGPRPLFDLPPFALHCPLPPPPVTPSPALALPQTTVLQVVQITRQKERETDWPTDQKARDSKKENEGA